MENRAFDQEYYRAKRAAARADRIEPRAKSARYDRHTNRIVVELRSGATFMFPAELAQRLAGASPKDLAEVQVTPSGAGLRWRKLDVDFSLPNLRSQVFSFVLFGVFYWPASSDQKARAKLGRNEVRKEEPAKARSSRRSKA